MSGPLASLRVIEIAGIGPGPFCGMMLADLGADVIRVDRLGPRQALDMSGMLRNRRSVAIDLRAPAGADLVLCLSETADALFEGFRPGVMERLGLGPDKLLARNPKLVFGRMTGWGQTGPRALTAGHDIDYIALTGALHAIGPADGPPVPPLNLLGDFAGGGLLLAYGLLAAILHARRTGQGQVVDAAMVDGVTTLLAPIRAQHAAGLWTDRREANLLDGGAPFYAVYACADGGWIALGALEPQFFALFVERSGLDFDPAAQYDRVRWPELRTRIEALFRTRSRDDWTALFNGTDACVAPVLTLAEAGRDPHLAARGTIRDDGTSAPAPRFSAMPAAPVRIAPDPGADTAAILAECGLDDAAVTALIRDRVVGA